MLYVFPKDYRAKLAGKSFRMRVEPLVDKAKVYFQQGRCNNALGYYELF